jgi:preprotein translocase subunit SecD
MILYIFGINLIKWFWFMLAIWIIVSLFTVMWISRILILLLANVMKNRWIFIGK